MVENNSPLDPNELREWQLRIEAADRHNILCHCRSCDREWVASSRVPVAVKMLSILRAGNFLMIK